MPRPLVIFKSKEELEQLYGELGTVKLVAQFLNIPVGRVYYLCSKLGVKVHHGSVVGHTTSEVTKRRIGDRALERIKAGKHSVKAGTGIELTVAAQLQKVGIKFTPQKLVYYLDDSGYRKFTFCDFFIEPNTCVYVDGCYWHACPEHFRQHRELLDKYRKGQPIGKTTRSIIKGSLKEALRDGQLVEQGFMVVRIWEHEVASGIRINFIQEVINASADIARHV